MLDFVRISYINPDYQLTSVNEILSYLLTAVSVWGEYGGLGSRITLLVLGPQYCRYNFFHVIKAVIIQNPQNSYKEMVSFFAKDQKISTDDLKE